MALKRSIIRRARVFQQVQTVEFGTPITFKSQFEYRWAKLLNILKKSGVIAEWYYEPVTFDFRRFGYKNRPLVYTPDFKVVYPDRTEAYYELKGFVTTRDISKYNRLAKHYSDIRLILVLQRSSKKDKAMLAKRSKNIIDIIENAEQVLKKAGI